MAPDKSLFSLLKDLATDPSEQSAYQSDPQGYLSMHGFADTHPSDIAEAMSLVADTLPPDTAAALGNGDPGDMGSGGDPVIAQLDHFVGAAQASAPPTVFEAPAAGATAPTPDLHLFGGGAGEEMPVDPDELDTIDEMDTTGLEGIAEYDPSSAPPSMEPEIVEPDATFEIIDEPSGDTSGVDLSDEGVDLHLQGDGFVNHYLELLDTDLDPGFF